MSLSAIIIEDEKQVRETLKALLEEFCVDIEISGLAGNVEDAVKLIDKRHPDVVFLDIELQTGSGFDVLENVTYRDFEIIFTTAHQHYALRAIKISSLDFLLKPIDINELQKAVEKVKVVKNRKIYRKQLETLMLNLQHSKSKHNRICLATFEGYEFIDIESIIYCKAAGSYTKFVLKGAENLLVSKHLRSYEDLLSDHDFMRIHNSCLINLEHIKKYIKSDGGYVIMSNGDHVSIARSRKDDFLKYLDETSSE